ncbi:Uncharacterized protein OBRU01_02427, partial [Operophtera brumata]
EAMPVRLKQVHVINCPSFYEKMYSLVKAVLPAEVCELVLMALLFYATGSYQRPIGVAKNLCQKSCSRFLEEVTQALIHPQMMMKYIVFPQTPLDRLAVSQQFYNKYGFPGIIGCIDCSHIKIFKPPAVEEHLYFCRKNYHSMNVQMICDSNYRILNVNPKYGGSHHDSFIWENSVVNEYVQNLHQNNEMVWLLGDSGYAQRPWLMTPFSNVAADSPEGFYNQKHIRARVTIENTFGRLKNRWRCLCKDRVLHYKPAKCAQIIQACCILYNIALDFGVPEPDGGSDDEGAVDVDGAGAIGVGIEVCVFGEGKKLWLL